MVLWKLILELVEGEIIDLGAMYRTLHGHILFWCLLAFLVSNFQLRSLLNTLAMAKTEAWLQFKEHGTCYFSKHIQLLRFVD